MDRPTAARFDAGPDGPGTQRPIAHLADAEEGSLVTEYGLLTVVGATVASLVVKWATGGAIWELFGALTDKVKTLLGA